MSEGGEIRRLLSTDTASIDCGELGLDEGRLRRLYEAMVTTRAVDERARRLHRDGEIGFYVASHGLEAVSCGSAMALEADDWLFPSHRDLGMYLLRGGSLRSWFDQLFGNGADLTKGRQLPGHASLPGGRFVSVSGRVGAQIPHAVGCAMAIKSRAAEACALASFGEATIGGADFHAAAILAARQRTPSVFVCRSASRDAGAEIGSMITAASRARAYGLAATRADGGDVLAVYDAVREARQSAARGGGATLVETVIAADAVFGEAPAEGVEATASDPIARMREFLDDAGYWDAARDDELRGRVAGRVEETVEAARAEAEPAAASMFDDVYEQSSWVLEEQRQRLLGGGAD